MAQPGSFWLCNWGGVGQGGVRHVTSAFLSITGRKSEHVPQRVNIFYMIPSAKYSPSHFQYCFLSSQQVYKINIWQSPFSDGKTETQFMLTSPFSEEKTETQREYSLKVAEPGNEGGRIWTWAVCLKHLCGWLLCWVCYGKGRVQRLTLDRLSVAVS